MAPRRVIGGAGRDPRKAGFAPDRALARSGTVAPRLHSAGQLRPKVYTIPADRPFLATLAAGFLEMAGDDPLRLPQMTVLLPTRRAVRALREAFLRVSTSEVEAGIPLLLPRMRPVGDLEPDGLAAFEGAADQDGLAVPPAIP